MPIYNEIFEAYRMEQEQINSAIKLLRKKGFSVYKLKKAHNGKKKK
tara:strand:+ start:287 stop:424 length:138 start_codon:yes stop_codon:yes gene_type:complete